MIAQPLAHSGGVTALAYHPGQPLLATVGADGFFKAWGVPLPPARAVTTPDRVLAAVLSAHGKRLFTAARTRSSAPGPMQPGARGPVRGHTGPVTVLAVTADGNTLFSAGADERFAFGTSPTAWRRADSAAMSVESTLVVCFGRRQCAGLVRGRRHGERGRLLPLVAAKPLPHPDAVNGMALSVDGNRALTVGNDKQARIWNLASGQLERAQPQPARSPPRPWRRTASH